MDVAPDPMAIGLLGAAAVMARAQRLAQLVKQFGLVGVRGCRRRLARSVFSQDLCLRCLQHVLAFVSVGLIRFFQPFIRRK